MTVAALPNYAYADGECVELQSPAPASTKKLSSLANRSRAPLPDAAEKVTADLAAKGMGRSKELNVFLSHYHFDKKELVLPRANLVRKNYFDHSGLSLDPDYIDELKKELNSLLQGVDIRRVSLSERSPVVFTPSEELAKNFRAAYNGRGLLNNALAMIAGTSLSAAETRSLLLDIVQDALISFIEYKRTVSAGESNIRFLDEDRAVLEGAVSIRLGRVPDSLRPALSKHIVEEMLGCLDSGYLSLPGASLRKNRDEIHIALENVHR